MNEAMADNNESLMDDNDETKEKTNEKIDYVKKAKDAADIADGMLTIAQVKLPKGEKLEEIRNLVKEAKDAHGDAVAAQTNDKVKEACKKAEVAKNKVQKLTDDHLSKFEQVIAVGYLLISPFKWLYSKSRFIVYLLGIIVFIFSSSFIYFYINDEGKTVSDVEIKVHQWIHYNCIVEETKQFWLFGDQQFIFKATKLKGFIDVDDKVIKLAATGNGKFKLQAYDINISSDPNSGRITFKNDFLKGFVNSQSNTMELKMSGVIKGVNSVN